MGRRRRAAAVLMALVVVGAALFAARWIGQDDLSSVLDAPQQNQDVIAGSLEGVDPASTRGLGVTPRGDLLYAARPSGAETGRSVCIVVVPGPSPDAPGVGCGKGLTVTAQTGDVTAVLHRHAREVGLRPGDDWGRFVDIDYAGQ